MWDEVGDNRFGRGVPIYTCRNIEAKPYTSCTSIVVKRLSRIISWLTQIKLGKSRDVSARLCRDSSCLRKPENLLQQISYKSFELELFKMPSGNDKTTSGIEGH